MNRDRLTPYLLGFFAAGWCSGGVAEWARIPIWVDVLFLAGVLLFSGAVAELVRRQLRKAPS